VRRVRCLAAIIAATMTFGALGLGPATADEPEAVPWTDLLPGFTTGYDPTSENDCKKGHDRCVTAVIREMDRRFQPLAGACSHNALFSLMYLRTTEEYQRSALTPGFFSDPSFINHQDAVFAEYYFDAWDDHYRGRPGVSDAWRLAFQAADAQKVSGTGNMLLGMSAHVNRDLPITLAGIGLVKPDGSSRKADHDKVNQFLVQVIEPLFDEASRRFDPSIDDGSIDGTYLDDTATLNLLQGWREQAWRNAERLVLAATPAERAAVEADIERSAALEAQLLIAATSYSAADANLALSAAGSLGAAAAQIAAAVSARSYNLAHGVLGGFMTDKRAARNAYCAANWDS
jgi:Family of unknown function (DUF5995)